MVTADGSTNTSPAPNSLQFVSSALWHMESPLWIATRGFTAFALHYGFVVYTGKELEQFDIRQLHDLKKTTLVIRHCWC